MLKVAWMIDQLRNLYHLRNSQVYDSKKLASHYMHSRAFIFDLISLIPLDILQFRFGTQPMLRFPRFFKVRTNLRACKFTLLIKMLRLRQVYRAIKYYYIVESRTVWPNLWRVVNLIHILLILAHWFGCFYFLLSEAEGFQVIRICNLNLYFCGLLSIPKC